MNGEQILSADNMFRTWVVDVKSLLRTGENNLRIYFHAVFKINVPKWENAEFRLDAPANNDQSDVQISMYSRKAGYHYGWDWGPRLVTAGVWRPVLIRSWDAGRIAGVQVFQADVSPEKADLDVHARLNITKRQVYQVEAFINGKEAAKSIMYLDAGKQTEKLPIQIKNPKLWWTHDLGDQPLYDIKVKLLDSHTVLDEQTVRIGVRSIEFVREPDEYGKSFFFKLNGKPVYIKGANYIPQDNFQNRVTPERYESLMTDAVKANMNMLRVWAAAFTKKTSFMSFAMKKDCWCGRISCLPAPCIPATKLFLKMCGMKCWIMSGACAIMPVSPCGAATMRIRSAGKAGAGRRI
ncbi:MAG: hypothetical protein U5R06_21290 [candidate division KSB1 bacterium]|nr:hypothetical protein [candidate division KSB1 bacterium]